VAVTLSTMLGASLAVSVTPAAGAPPPPSAAGLDSQAQQLEAQILSNGAALHKMAQVLADTQARVAAADAAIVQSQATLSGLEADLAQAEATLRSIALHQYMQDTDSAGLSDFIGSPEQLAESAAYRQLATTSESDAVDRFLQAQSAVQRQEAQLEAQRAAAGAAYASISRQDAALKAAAGALQAQLDKVRAEQAALGPPANVDVADLVGANGSLAEDLYRLRVCESGDNYQDDTGNGYYGAYQFALSTWQNLGYSGLPSDAPPAQQDQAAIRLEQAHGWGEWPACAAMLGLD
jgi:hypothetical protein